MANYAIMRIEKRKLPSVGRICKHHERLKAEYKSKDIEAKRINCVITKGLSRLGRNYLDCGLYLEVFFPEHGVRYISVNDGVNTLNKSAMDVTPFRNILNEMYAADVSMKVKSALRARI